MACRILVPRPVIKPQATAVKAQVLTTVMPGNCLQVFKSYVEGGWLDHRVPYYSAM